MKAFSMLSSGFVVRSKRSYLLLVCLAACCANGLRLKAQILTREDLQRETAAYEAASRSAEPPQMPAVEAGRIWLRLGILYQDAGRYGPSETAYEHAMRLLTAVPVSAPDLADTIDRLGTLYMETGNLKGAEAAESKAMKMREAAGLEPELPQSWYHLSALYLREHQAERSRSFALRAFDAFSKDRNATPEDKIGAQLVLSGSLCQLHRYPEAISYLQSGLQLSNEFYGAEQLPTGLNTFLLGYAYWKSGDAASANSLMQRGSEILGKTLGWHPTYLSVLTQYAHFLRDTHEQRAAHEVEREIKQGRAHLSREPNSQTMQTIDIAALF
ncbi:tetratricopeptide repeat protein [Tunturiibacter gelidiferens]|uniref:Tetratricopeptide repeat protein n=1 Tax=Tunturiibacter gelidiferens TaxID=3069689 RepID=A0AAU7Z239_9BACT